MPKTVLLVDKQNVRRWIKQKPDALNIYKQMGDKQKGDKQKGDKQKGDKEKIE